MTSGYIRFGGGAIKYRSLSLSKSTQKNDESVDKVRDKVLKSKAFKQQSQREKEVFGYPAQPWVQRVRDAGPLSEG